MAFSRFTTTSLDVQRSNRSPDLCKQDNEGKLLRHFRILAWHSGFLTFFTQMFGFRTFNSAPAQSYLRMPFSYNINGRISLWYLTIGCLCARPIDAELQQKSWLVISTKRRDTGPMTSSYGQACVQCFKAKCRCITRPEIDSCERSVILTTVNEYTLKQLMKCHVDARVSRNNANHQQQSVGEELKTLKQVNRLRGSKENLRHLPRCSSLSSIQLEHQLLRVRIRINPHAMLVETTMT